MFRIPNCRSFQSYSRFLFIYLFIYLLITRLLSLLTDRIQFPLLTVRHNIFTLLTIRQDHYIFNLLIRYNILFTNHTFSTYILLHYATIKCTKLYYMTWPLMLLYCIVLWGKVISSLFRSKGRTVYFNTAVPSIIQQKESDFPQGARGYNKKI